MCAIVVVLNIIHDVGGAHPQLFKFEKYYNVCGSLLNPFDADLNSKIIYYGTIR